VPSGHPSFAEPLPVDCPPEDAAPLFKGAMIRLAKQATPTAADFLSYKALGGANVGGVCPCIYSACSMFQHDNDDEQIRAMQKLPKFRRFRYAYVISVDANSGLGLEGQNKHVSVWLYSTFNPLSYVLEVKPFHG